MSNRRTDIVGVTFEPVGAPRPPAAPRPTTFVLILGVIYPAIVIAIELASHMSAQAFFDPMPTHVHALAVALVPAGNLLVWLNLRKLAPRRLRWVAFANGGAIAISAVFAFLYLPLLPVGVVAIIFGIGLLPLAPIVSFACAVALRARARACNSDPSGRPFAAGLAAGIALLVVADLPAAATRLGVQWAASGEPSERAQGLALLRNFGSDDLLLRLCYDAVRRPVGLLAAPLAFAGGVLFGPAHPIDVSPAQAREIYYRVHGAPFNTRPAPVERGQNPVFADFQFDNDHGGSAVGGRIKNLDLVASRIDGSVSGNDAVAYLEWRFEVRNTGLLDREARLQIALPPGGVVSRATLWVNGEEREAAYGGRGEVRAAYSKVAVQQRRDPLLVTSKGADRVLVQAFPVPRGGGTIAFKLGISAPLEIVNAAEARLALPAIVDRDFSFGSAFHHDVWIESKQQLAVPAAGLTPEHLDSGLFRIAGSLADRDLSGTRPTIRVDREPGIGRLAARLGEGTPVVQEVVPRGAQASALMLVIDGSARLADRATSLIEALDTIPPGIKVGAIIASEPMQQVALAPWSDLQKQRVALLLRSTAFAGGQDNAPVLVEALQRLEAEPNAVLLWVHGPQPIAFHDSTARLEQAQARLSHLPQLVLYAVEGGPNEALPDTPWAWSASLIPQSGALSADLADFFARATNFATPVIRRLPGAASEGLAKGSDHIARLWAKDRVLELMRADPARNRAAAVTLAADYRLVTPVSGAVVLETQQQYDEARLSPVPQATMPTMPEPQEWALLLIAGAGSLWLLWRIRQRGFAVA
jgi:hypothetical protein